MEILRAHLVANSLKISLISRLIQINRFDKSRQTLLTKGQLISKAFEPKNEPNYFFISALASKNGSNQKNEGTLLYQ